MSWDSHLNSILSAADGSVARMREHLMTARESPKDILPQRDISYVPQLDTSRVSPISPSPDEQWGNTAGIEAQLQTQNQAIQSLTEALRIMERERGSQQKLLQSMQGELQKLQEQECERHKQGELAIVTPGTECKMEQWKREVEREMSCLRDHLNRSTSLGTQQESYREKLRREETEQLRREVEQLKFQLRRQEEDLFRQQSEIRETKRPYEHTSKTLKSLTDSYQMHSSELSKTVSQFQDLQYDVQQLRSTVAELKEEVRGLILRALPGQNADRKASKRAAAYNKHTSSSDSDYSPTASLGDVSSDELSWALEMDSALQRRKARGCFGSARKTANASGRADKDSLEVEEEAEAEYDCLSELSVADLD